MSEEIGKWLQLGLRSLYERGRHYDVTVIVQKDEFPCHKSVLAAASGYFDAMFGSAMIEANSDKVSISDVQAAVFKDILDFIYGINENVTKKNVETLLHAANLLQISLLKTHCENFLLQHLSAENCVGFWVTGMTYVCEQLETASWQFIIENFDQVRKSDELLRLEIDNFLKIIKNDNLNTQSEDNVCKVAMNWIKFDESSRRHHFTEVLKELRLCQVSLEFLLDEIFSSKYANSSEFCTKLLKDAIKYHAVPERRHMFDSLTVRPRNSSSDVTLTVILGRRQFQYGTNSTECIGYSDKDKTWYSICQFPVDLEDEFATCPYGNDMFVSGGTGKPDAMFYFSSKQYKWMEKANMENGRYRHSMVAIKDSIFAIGGYNFGTVGGVEEYDIPTNSWETVGELLHAVDAVSASAHREKIFVFGGWKGFSEETSVIQCFDTATNTCSVVGNLPSPQRNIRTLAYNNKTYLAFSNGEIHTFKPESKIKLIHKIDKFDRKNFGMLKDSTALYLLGGCVLNEDNDSFDDNNNLHDGIECVTADDTNVRSLPNELPVPMEVYGCFKTLIRQKYPLVAFNEVLEYMG